MTRMLVTTGAEAFDLIASFSGKRPLKLDEITAVERRLRVTFPSVFRRLMQLTGGNLGWLFPNGCPSCHELPTFQEIALEIAESCSMTWPSHDLAFDQFQGEAVAFFHADGVSDDPEVFWFYEATSKPTSSGQQLSAFITSALNNYLRLAVR